MFLNVNIIFYIFWEKSHIHPEEPLGGISIKFDKLIILKILYALIELTMVSVGKTISGLYLNIRSFTWLWIPFLPAPFTF